jgi:Protein of unknown function (DUF3775)
MKLSEAALKVIALAQQVRDYYSRELPKRHPNYPVIESGEPETPPPAEEIQLRGFLASLDPEMIYQLILIMYLGRGDFEAADLKGYYGALKKTFDTPEIAASQMMEKAPLADYLSDGLAELQRRKINVDRSPFPSVNKTVNKK